MFDFINKPLGIVLQFIAEALGGSFALAVFVFTLLINLALIPLSIKSQKSSVQQTRIKPKLDELKKKYGDDKQAYSQAMQKLYQEENVSMSGGCLPMILRLVLMMSIYTLIMSPLTYMTDVNNKLITNVESAITTSLNDLQKKDSAKYDKYKSELNWQGGNRNELSIVGIVRSKDGFDKVKAVMGDEAYAKIEKDLEAIKQKDDEVKINYTFITKKLDLTQSPKFSFNIFEEARLIWTMPLLAFASQIFTSWMSMKMQKKINPDAPSMAGMMYMMPLISLFIGFALPAGVTFYWACSSLVGGFIQIGVQNFYGPHKMLSRERAKELCRQCDFEAGQIKKLNTAEGGDEN